MRLDDPNGFQVLSMLKLDAGTRDIPVLTYTASYTMVRKRTEEEAEEPIETEIFAPKQNQSDELSAGGGPASPGRLLHFQIREVIPRLNSRSRSKRRIVEVHPRKHRASVIEAD